MRVECQLVPGALRGEYKYGHQGIASQWRKEVLAFVGQTGANSPLHSFGEMRGGDLDCSGIGLVRLYRSVLMLRGWNIGCSIILLGSRFVFLCLDAAELSARRFDWDPLQIGLFKLANVSRSNLRWCINGLFCFWDPGKRKLSQHWGSVLNCDG